MKSKISVAVANHYRQDFREKKIIFTQVIMKGGKGVKCLANF
jgi:hypothetical protein